MVTNGVIYLTLKPIPYLDRQHCRLSTFTFFIDTESETNPNNNLMMRGAGLSTPAVEEVEFPSVECSLLQPVVDIIILLL